MVLEVSLSLNYNKDVFSNKATRGTKTIQEEDSSGTYIRMLLADNDQ